MEKVILICAILSLHILGCFSQGIPPSQPAIEPTTPTVTEGIAFNLTCSSLGGSPLPQIYWYKNGDSQKIKSLYLEGKTKDKPTKSVLTIIPKKEDDGSTYRCTVWNKAITQNGLVEASTSINVNYFPRVKIGPENPVQVEKGDTAELILDQPPLSSKIDGGLQPEIIKRIGDTGFQTSCSAVAKPKPKVKWYKDGIEIDNSGQYQISVLEQPETVPNQAFKVVSTLKFAGPKRIYEDQLMPTDRGEYSCEFTNEVASKASTMLLRVKHSPIVLHKHNKVAADVGETASLSCRMQAYPYIIFDWAHVWAEEWSFLTEAQKWSLLTDETQYNKNVTKLTDDIYEGVLHISNVTKSTYGEYQCKAYNSLGTQRTKITLQEKSKPEPPKNVRALLNSPDFIKLEWDEGFNGGYDDTTYTIHYKKIGDHVGKKLLKCENPFYIFGLEQFTTYQFRVKALNIQGESPWSRDIKVTRDNKVT